MMPAASKGGGQAMAFPDVCKVPGAPPVPTPFPNMNLLSTCDDTIEKVQVVKKDAVVLSSSMSASKLDEPGSAGGMVSGMNRGKIAFRKGSSKVCFGGKAAVMLTAATAHNGASANAPVGAHTSPSQTKVLVSP